MHRSVAALLVLLLAVGLVYGQIYSHAFVEFDDPLYVTANRQITNGLSLEGIAWAFTTDAAYMWQPITWLSYLLDFSLHGRESAGPWLLTNLALHGANVALLFALLLRWTSLFWPSLIVAGLFALHPIQVESVAWVSARKEVLAGSFLLMTLWAYTRHARTRETRDFVWVAIGMVCTLAAKPTHVALPFALILFDTWPLRRSTATAEGSENSPGVSLPGLLKEKWTLIVIMMASIGLNFRMAANAENVWVTDPPLLARISAAGVNVIGYLGRILWPSDLTIVYPNALQSVMPAEPLAKVALAFGALIAVTAICFALRHRTWAPLIGWLFFIGMLFPTIGLAPAGLRSPHDRYLYVPIIGLFVGVVFGVANSLPAIPRCRGPALVGCGVLILACASASYTQVGHWQNSQTLFDHGLSVTRDNAALYFSRGISYARKGNRESAIVDLRRSIEIHPGHVDALSSLGYLLGENGQYEEAILHLREARRVRPNWTQSTVNLANVLKKDDQADEALSLLEEAIRESPRSTTARYWYGYHLEALGRIEQARDSYDEVLKIDANHRWARARIQALNGSASQ